MKDSIEMQEFFNYFKSYIKINRILEISESTITKCLRYYGCKEDFSMEEEIDKKCAQAKEYASLKDINVISREQAHSPRKLSHIAFNLYGPEDYTKITKLYISINYKKTPEVLDQIYLYLIDNNIRCETKISSNDRSDNFVVRLYDIKDVEPFLQFCDSNEIIKNNLKKINPFIATKNNIGVVQDGYIKDSFNGGLASALTSFINACNKFDELENMNIEYFLEFLMEVIDKESDENLKFNYLCIYNSINAIKMGLDPVNEIKNNIGMNTYNF